MFAWETLQHAIAMTLPTKTLVMRNFFLVDVVLYIVADPHASIDGHIDDSSCVADRRALQGALTSGLFPSTLGMVGDLFPEKERARWIGIVSASYTAGFIFGPTIGGILFDVWGFAAPFTTSAILAMLALIATAILVPETRPRDVRERERQRKKEAVDRPSLWETLPRPLTLFGTLLLIDFMIIFAFAFIEPELVFYRRYLAGWY